LAEIIAIITIHFHQIIDCHRAYGKRDGGDISYLGKHTAVMGGQKSGIGSVRELDGWLELTCAKV
jgi:hypothetical protein